MLGKFEKRYFQNEEKVWLGKYRNLTNILHWHPECELIRIVKGEAKISYCHSPGKGDVGPVGLPSAEGQTDPGDRSQKVNSTNRLDQGR